jgi:hypothetical protein
VLESREGFQDSEREADILRACVWKGVEEKQEQRGERSEEEVAPRRESERRRRERKRENLALHSVTTTTL